MGQADAFKEYLFKHRAKFPFEANSMTRLHLDTCPRKPHRTIMSKNTPSETTTPQSGGIVGQAELPKAGQGAAAPDIQSGSRSGDTGPAGPRLQALYNVSHAYGARSFENYARIRGLAETLRDEFCNWLSGDEDCVFLVPPEGRFTAQNYQSAAFSVAGKGYLPLKPISFGLAVRVSEDKDFMRLKLTCRKEGDMMFVQIERGSDIEIKTPTDAGALNPLLEGLYDHLMTFFQSQIDDYDHGRYGLQEIGFDIQRMNS